MTHLLTYFVSDSFTDILVSFTDILVSFIDRVLANSKLANRQSIPTLILTKCFTTNLVLTKCVLRI